METVSYIPCIILLYSHDGSKAFFGHTVSICPVRFVAFIASTLACTGVKSGSYRKVSY